MRSIASGVWLGTILTENFPITFLRKRQAIRNEFSHHIGGDSLLISQYWWQKFFLYIFLAGFSVLATPLLMPPILYF
jgi:hypothetical protein